MKARCYEEELDFRAMVMDEMVLTVEQRNLGLQINGELISVYSQVVVVRIPSLGCRAIVTSLFCGTLRRLAAN